MVELETGRPEELVRTLHNWLREASDPIGSLPTGTDPVEWAVRRFTAWWVGPLRGAVRDIEDCPRLARDACRAGDTIAAAAEIETLRQSVGDLRDNLGAVLLGRTVAPEVGAGRVAVIA